jgi:hypothetical protein
MGENDFDRETKKISKRAVQAREQELADGSRKIVHIIPR